MKKTLSLTGILFFLSLSFVIIGQEQPYKPSVVAKAVYFDVSPPLQVMSFLASQKVDQTWKEGFIKNIFDVKKVIENFSSDYIDPVKQNFFAPLTNDTTIQNFDGTGNVNYLAPPDTHGDVGPNHYFQVVNASFAIYNKTGTAILGPLDNSTIWNGITNNSNSGDAIVLYDEQADRWLFSQFSLPNYPNGPFYQMIAVSQTPDPTGSWYRWQFSFTDLPDYPKFGIWPDGYYMSSNRFASGTGNWNGVGAVAFDRTAMLAGNAGAQMIMFTLSTANEAYSLLPSDCDGPFPANGTPAYFAYIRTYSPYHIGMLEFHADWITPSNSTLGNFQILPVSSFNSDISGGIPQSGTATMLDPITDRLMYRLQYRKFDDHQSMVVNHTVNAGSNVAGIRWYELRKTTGAWSVYQESTYSPDSKCRWMGSMAMDESGNIALGYSISSSSTFPSIRYTGRMNLEPLGVMTRSEKGIINGGGSQTGIYYGRSRWGDYSGMSVDPTQANTFWYTQEYYASTTYADWKTRIASFTFGPVLPTADFSANVLTPCLNNMVILTDQSSGPPTSWQWSITPATVTYIDGTSSTSRHPHVKFNKYGNYSVSLTAANSVGNNTKTKTNYISVNTGNADFTASLTTVVAGNSTVFTDASTCNVNSWSWNFGSGATPSTANTAGPHTVTYNTTGTKIVTLTVNGTSTQTKTNYINVISSAINMSNLALTTCSGSFYDPGGSGSDYSNNQDFTMVFTPATANSNLKFVFSYLDLELETNCNFDYLKIYNGSSASAPLIGTYCGTNSPGTVTASNTTGSLTFVFHSDGAVVSSGWAASISCVASTLPPIADLTANNTTPATGSTVFFTDLSINVPTSWLWAFTPNTVTYVNTTSATSQNPQVQFNNNGIYSVSLTATNVYGSDNKTKTSYIYVGTAGLWTGITSSDWNTASNWQNYNVPSASTNVFLPSSASHWPSLNGNMILGSSCSNLVLSGNSELTCNGDFVINPGDTLAFNGTGTIKIEGDWNDYGIFNAGTGNVEFTGSSPAKITGGIDKRIYVANYNHTPFPKNMTNITGGTLGPSGDDAYSDVSIGFSFNYFGVNYSQARINTNGWISLNVTGSADAMDNSELFTSALPATVIAPWWDDLSTDATSSVSYITEGIAPDRVFIAEWKRVLAFYSTGTTARLSFQVKLYESSNVIEFCYGTAEAGNHDVSESASIGIKDITGGSGHFKEATTGSTTYGVTNLSSASNWPTINYRFTPPTLAGTFYNLIENKTNATLTIQPDIIVNGDVILK